MDNVYSFVDHWRIKGTVEEISEIFSRGEDFPQWWPGIYLDAVVLERGATNGLGKTIWFRSQGGRLLYVLEWTARTTGISHPYGFAIEATGDFVGTGRWTFRPDGEWTDVTYDWNIRAENPLLRYASPFVKPILAANHRYAMRIGEKSLQIEIDRRHAATADERALIPAPPGPITRQQVLPPLGAALALAALVGSIFWARRGHRSTA